MPWNIVFQLLTNLACIARGFFAGIGLAVAMVFVLANMPTTDPTGNGAELVVLLVAAPLFAIIGMAAEAWMANWVFYYD